MRTPPITHIALALVATAAVALLATAPPAFAVGTTVGLGTVGSYSVLGGQSVTNTGPSTLSGDVGVNPGTSITGFPPGVIGGVFHNNDGPSLQAQSDLTTAYNNAAGQASDASVGAELGGLTLTPGVYTAEASTQITGPLTLDAQGNPNAVFIFQVGSALTTATSSSVLLLGDAQSCHVFWQIGSSATLGTNSTFVGTIMALTSITANTGATVEGRALARNGSVTLDTNVFTDVTCATSSSTPPPSGSTAPTGSTTGTPTETTTGTPTETTTGAPSGSPSVTLTGSPSVAPSETSLIEEGGGGTPTSTESGPVGGTVLNQGVLSNTGGPSGALIGIGIAALLVGVALVVSARLRHTS